MIVGGGVRFDDFRYDVGDELNPVSELQYSGKWQGKASLAFTPSSRLPLTFHANYGRGINSIDARGVVQHPDLPRLATTDFYQVGASFNLGRFGLSADAFLIDHSNEQVYIPDDWQFRVQRTEPGLWLRSQSFGSTHSLHRVERSMTKMANAFFRGGRTPVRGQCTPFRGQLIDKCNELARLERIASHARDQSLPPGRD